MHLARNRCGMRRFNSKRSVPFANLRNEITMKIPNILWLVVPLIVGLIAANLIAQPQQSTNENNSTPRFEYATLTTVTPSEESGSASNRMIWNAGVQDIIGDSNSSVRDAQRRLNARLGGGNDSRTNLSVLLTTIGNDGWQLVESSEEEQGMVRVFVRLQR